MNTTRRQQGKIRNAGFADVSAIFNLIKSNPKELVPRSQSDIIQNVDRFLVCEYRKKIVGVVSWAILPEIERAAHPTVEIKSLAVQKSVRKRDLAACWWRRRLNASARCIRNRFSY